MPLDENGRRSISQNEIISKYSKKYNIEYNTFIRQYLKKLNNLRKKDHSLKLSQMVDNQIRWELNE